MDSHNDLNAEPTLFSATLTPNRSLGRTGFVVLMAAVGIVSFVAGMIFLIAGAWPVFGFFGLDVVLIYWAFRANYRAAAAYEQVMITSSELKIRKVSAKGQAQEWTLNPLWVRLERETHPEFGVQKLLLVSRGRRLSIGGFLGSGGEGKLWRSPHGRSQRGQARPDADRIFLAHDFPAKCVGKSYAKS